MKNSIAMLVLVVVAGCSSPGGSGTSKPARPDSAPAESPSAAETIRITDAGNTFQVAFRPDPHPIEASKPFSLHVDVSRRPSGAPIGEEASLVVDAAMPEHRHGMNTQPRITRVGPGRFLAEGMLLHMPGRWELYFDIVEGAVTRRATYVIELE